MKPRVLFVSRERFRLPLDGAQKRKWDAVAGGRRPSRARRRAGRLDRRATSASVSSAPARRGRSTARSSTCCCRWRIARELREFRPDAALVQGVHEPVAFLVARARSRASTRRLILDVQGDWHEATRLYGSPLRRLLNPVNDALAPLAVRRRGRGAHRLDADDRARAGARRRAGGGVPVVRRRRGVPRAAAGAAARAAARRLRRRARALQGLRHARRGMAARGAARARTRRCTSSATGRCATAPSASLADLPAQTRVVASPHRRGGRRRRWTRRGSSACRRAPRGCRASRSRPPAAAARSSAATAPASPTSCSDGENGLLVDPGRRRRRSRTRSSGSSPTARYAERLGAAARRTGEEWGVTPAEYAAQGARARRRRPRELTCSRARADQAAAEELRLPRDRRDGERHRRRQRRRPHAARAHVPQGQRPARTTGCRCRSRSSTSRWRSCASSATWSSTSTPCSRHYVDGAPLPEGAVLITFDDGYRDNLENAAPVLHQHGYPAVQFVPLAYVGDRQPLPHEEHLAASGVINPTVDWEELGELERLGVRIESHGISHRPLADLELDEAAREIAISKLRLEERLGRPVRAFSYVKGSEAHYKQVHLSLVRQAGYDVAFTAVSGANSPASDPLAAAPLQRRAVLGAHVRARARGRVRPDRGEGHGHRHARAARLQRGARHVARSDRRARGARRVPRADAGDVRRGDVAGRVRLVVRPQPCRPAHPQRGARRRRHAARRARDVVRRA